MLKEALKKKSALIALEYITSGMDLGLGTGTTVRYFIEGLGELVKEGMKVRTIATSVASEKLAKECGIKVESFATVPFLDLTVDGADEIDQNFNLIKGGGGALLREKMIASASKQLIIIADESKYVQFLGAFLLPVEVISYGWESTQRHIEQLGCTSNVRFRDGKPFHTDNGNLILDCDFGLIRDPGRLEVALNMIPGVVENGLFVGMVSKVILGGTDGVKVLTKPM